MQNSIWTIAQALVKLAWDENGDFDLRGGSFDVKMKRIEGGRLNAKEDDVIGL